MLFGKLFRPTVAGRHSGTELEEQSVIQLNDKMVKFRVSVRFSPRHYEFIDCQKNRWGRRLEDGQVVERFDGDWLLTETGRKPISILKVFPPS